MNDTYHISYDKLWKLLIDKHMMKKDLLIKAAQLYGFDTASAREVPEHEGGRNLVFMIGTLAKICIALQCKLSDIVEIHLKEV